MRGKKYSWSYGRIEYSYDVMFLSTVNCLVDDENYKTNCIDVYKKEGIEGFFQIHRYNLLEWLIRHATQQLIIGLDKTQISCYSGELSAIRYAGYFYIDKIEQDIKSMIKKRGEEYTV